MGTVNLRMASAGQKPYRVYRGGRVEGKGAARAAGLEGEALLPQRRRRAVGRSSSAGNRRLPRRRAVLLAILALIVLFVIWCVAGYISVSSGVSAANRRLPSSVRTACSRRDSGLLYSTPTNILLLGTDHADDGRRAQPPTSTPTR